MLLSDMTQKKYLLHSIPNCNPYIFIRDYIHVVNRFCRDFNILLRLENRVFSFQNCLKNLEPSYKKDLDLWDGLGRVKLVV